MTHLLRYLSHRAGYTSMPIIACFCRHICMVVLGLYLAACGTFSPSLSSVSSHVQPTPQQFVLPPPTSASIQTPVPYIQQTIPIGTNIWFLDQPKGIKPIVAATSDGILWVQFPPMETNANSEQNAMSARPTGDYTILYTPTRTGGGALVQNAKRLLVVPSTNGQYDVSISSATAAGANHFLLRSYELLRNAQNGGTTRIRWIEPDTNTIKEVVTATEGGGTFLTTASNQDWLFWSKYRSRATSMYDSYAQAGLVSMHNGQNEPLTLDGPNVAIQANWAADGTLRYTSGDNQKSMILDPVTKRVHAQR